MARRTGPATRAGRSPLQGIPPRDLHRAEESNDATASGRVDQATRTAIPVIAELWRQLAPPILASVNGQVEPGEIIAIYQRHRLPARAIICGASRVHRIPPKELEPGWRFYAAIRVLEDGAEALPVEVPC